MLWIKGHSAASAPTLPIVAGPSWPAAPAAAISGSFCRTSMSFVRVVILPAQFVATSENVLTSTLRFLAGAALPASSVATQFNPKSKSFVPPPSVASA